MKPLSEDMIAFMEGIIHQEKFEKGGYSYDMKTFTSIVKAESYIENNPSFELMEERNGYLYVGKKTEIEMPSNMNESYDGNTIYEAALKAGLSEEGAREMLKSLGGRDEG